MGLKLRLETNHSDGQQRQVGGRGDGSGLGV